MRLRTTSFHGLLGAIILSAGFAAPMSLAGEEPASSEETVDVRIKMPDGSVIIQKAKKSPSRVNVNAPKQSSKRLSDGSRVSLGSGGGAVTTRTSGARSATKKSSSASQGVGSGRGGGSGPVSENPAAGEQDVAGDTSAESALNVPTVGPAQHGEGGAIGGQTVNFAGTGMYGAIIGNTVYLVGVELVHADQGFEVVRGTRIGSETAIMDEADLSNRPATGRNAIDGKTQLKLSFESGTVVELVMYSQSNGNESVEREERTWTVRIR